ncbi:MAG: ABC transporter ATP-binding protein [Actinomycetota bacterium]
MTAIEVKGLVKEYKSRRQRVRALNAVDVKVEQGECFGLLGPNGAGKTTFVKCLLGLINPTAGSIEVFGQDPTHASARSAVGFASEVPTFPGFLSAREVMNLHAELIGYSKQEAEAQITQLLTQAELVDGPKRVKAFSKGMVRRLALAQSLLGRPQLLVLDEPTADLDPLGRRDVRNVLQGLKDLGVTILLNSHLLSEVERICDRVLIIHQGNVLAEGSVDDLVPEGSDLETVFIDLVEKAKS